MDNIREYFTNDHRDCDQHLAAAEARIEAGDWPAATAAWQTFAAHMRLHFQREEEHLFPAFEQATGNTQGPTAVMRMEHEQMRVVLEQLDAAARDRDRKAFLAHSESLMVLCQQHNMKEEQVLYPMCEQVIPQAEALLQQVAALRPDA